MQVTNPVQAIWWLARTANKQGTLSAIVTPIFTAPFLCVRIAPIPYYVMSSAWALLAQPYGEMAVPVSVRVKRVNWAVCFTAFTVGGWWWGYSLILGCLKHRKRKRAAAETTKSDTAAAGGTPNAGKAQGKASRSRTPEMRRKHAVRGLGRCNLNLLKTARAGPVRPAVCGFVLVKGAGWICRLRILLQGPIGDLVARD